MRITQLVQWKINGENGFMDHGIINLDQITPSHYDSKGIIDNLVDNLIENNSSAIPHGYTPAYDLSCYNEDKQLQQNVDNVVMPGEYEGKNTLTRTLVFASHPDVIQWVNDNNPDKLEVVNIPDDYKIIVLDKNHQSDNLLSVYDYIMVPNDCIVRHF